MRFHEKVINLEALGYYSLVGSIASMHFDKPWALDVYLVEGGTPNFAVHHCTMNASLSVTIAARDILLIPLDGLDCRAAPLAVSYTLTPMPATRSTTKRHRETQTSRQNAVRQDRGDYYKCDTCGGLFSRYHSSHKRHIRICEARKQEMIDEEAFTLAERYTPTPEPYIRAPSSTGTEFESEADDHGTPAS